MSRKLVGVLLAACMGGSFVLGAPQTAGASPAVAQVSTDALTTSGAQHQTEVEPVTAAWGNTIVSTFQVGRYSSGGSGSAGVGFATSTDNGATWTNGILPGVTTEGSPAGSYPRTVNMTVGYDAKHGKWLISNNVETFDGTNWWYTALLVSSSNDGINWNLPVAAVIGATPPSIRPDKGWLVCDNSASSPYYGRCYATYIAQAFSKRFQMIHSDDGGQTWSAPVGTASNAVGYDPVPVVRADGTVVVVGTQNSLTQVVAFRSSDGGATWTDPVVVSTIQLHTLAASMRTRSKPSPAIDAAGDVYVAWYDCRFRSGCTSNDIVLSQSLDAGATWSAVTRVNVDPTTSTVEHFVAGLGVVPGTAGASARLNLVFYEMPDAACATATCLIYAMTTSSTDGGATWSVPDQLNAQAMTPSMLAGSSLGQMLADYHTVAYVHAAPWAVMAMATAKVGSSFRESMWAARLLSANVVPTASFTTGCAGLTCDVDASASNDPDGSIASYAWNFGDGATASGVAAAHTYATPGNYTITLTVTDNLFATATASAPKNVGGVNVAPTAQFVDPCNALACTFDASASFDPDGSIVSYAWTFGDGTIATGVTAAHSYAMAGTWPVTLTVTDDIGATDVRSGTAVSTPPPNPAPYGSDSFGRTVSGGWGSADTGGTWNLSGGSANFSVANGVGVEKSAAAATTLTANLPGAANIDTDLQVRVAADQPAAGQGHWATLILRKVATNNEYRVRVRFGTGGVSVAALKLANSSSSQFIGSEVSTGLAYVPNQFYRVRAETFGTNPTTIRARVWIDGQPEPSTWTLTQTDSTATIQGSGSVGLISYDSGSAVPLNVSFDDFVAGPLNRVPVAAFSSNCNSLSCSFDASGSSDPDGSIVTDEWSFGDGVTSLGAAPQHSYAVPGTYTVTLTVTDNQGAREYVAHTVVVNNGGNQPPVASFTSSCTLLGCTFDGTTSFDPDGNVVAYAWNFGDGNGAAGATAAHTYQIAGTWPVQLTVTDDLGGTSAVVHNVVVAPASPPGPLALDAFGRTVSSGWGSADQGGAWTIGGIAGNFSVGGGIAKQKLTTVNSAAAARLLGVSNTDVDVQLRIAADQTPVGTGYWANVTGRYLSTNNEYRARVRFASNGVFAGAYKLPGGSAVLIGSEVATGLSATPGQFYRVRLNVAGTSPTTLKIKVWLDGQAEPAAWNVNVTDSTASLQTSGSVGLGTWVQGSTTLPLTFSFDDVVVRPANFPPVATFTANCNLLSCSVDASASSDPDGGSIASYDWSFGDGGVASGVLPTAHDYAVSGTYTITLTVTDNLGVRVVASQQVSVN